MCMSHTFSQGMNIESNTMQSKEPTVPAEHSLAILSSTKHPENSLTLDSFRSHVKEGGLQVLSSRYFSASAAPMVLKLTYGHFR